MDWMAGRGDGPPQGRKPTEVETQCEQIAITTVIISIRNQARVTEYRRVTLRRDEARTPSPSVSPQAASP